jgi:hypothetical protein
LGESESKLGANELGAMVRLIRKEWWNA